MFYMFNQNNSGGWFTVNDTLCHRVIIEADSKSEAVSIAEDLGCYWDGVDQGIDCSCCGDRWGRSPRLITEDLLSWYGVSAMSFAEWKRKYSRYQVVTAPERRKDGFSGITGVISFENIEEYAQYLANEFGWTTPDVRIFYKDGTVTEIFSEKFKRGV